MEWVEWVEWECNNTENQVYFGNARLYSFPVGRFFVLVPGGYHSGIDTKEISAV